jgi:hypothetical protein
MHNVKLNLVNDPYTAFTVDINLDGQEWTIKPVSGVVQKIEAAQFFGDGDSSSGNSFSSALLLPAKFRW